MDRKQLRLYPKLPMHALVAVLYYVLLRFGYCLQCCQARLYVGIHTWNNVCKAYIVVKITTCLMYLHKQDEIEVALSHRGTGFVGFGWRPSQGLTGACRVQSPGPYAVGKLFN